MDIFNKMVIRTQWGRSWEVEIYKNQTSYYLDERGWNRFVSDNDLGENESFTFTHTGGMCFTAKILDQNGEDVVRPRDPMTMASFTKSLQMMFHETEEKESSSKNNEIKKGAIV